MKVKCLHNSGKDLQEQTLALGYSKNCEMNLEINKNYNVYGMYYIKQVIYYLIFDGETPDWYPSELFTIIDNRISYMWYFKKYDPIDPGLIEAFWGYYELIIIDNHYSDLVDREYKAMSIFRKRKEQMDMEFPDASITEVAQLGDETWLICPTCIEAWEFTSCRDGMVRCPKCKNVMHNPRYKNELPLI
jgi:hypothetical protein